ncbi:MAG: hypothetical protein ACP5LH_00175 [Candidatus Micrarchaeia archaeon]
MDDLEHRIIKKLLFKLVSKHIGGTTLTTLLSNLRENEKNKLHTTITFLNEDQSKARYNTTTYIELIKQISRLNMNADISLRLSQFGYTLNNRNFESYFLDVVRVAADNNIRCWIESEPNLEAVSLLKSYRTFVKEYKNLGVEISLNSPLDVNVIKKYIRNNDNIKLTSYFIKRDKDKKDNKKVKNKDKLEINNEEYDGKYLLERYISDSAKLLQAGANVSILESDEKLIGKIVGVGKEYRKNIMFELPLGSSKKWLSKFTKMKINLSIYTPYGKDWVHYVINRLSYGHHKVSAITAKFLELDGYKNINIDNKNINNMTNNKKI